MIFFNDEKPLPLNKEKSLLDIAIENKISLNHSCGGFGTCGTCRVFIANYSQLPERNPIEQEMATDRGFHENERLACQTMADRAIHLKTPK